MTKKTKQRVKKYVPKKVMQRSNNNFLFILVALCATILIGLFLFINVKPDSYYPKASPPPQLIGWKTFENERYYFKFPAGMTSQVVLTEKSADVKMTPSGFTKTETKKINVDGRNLDEVFYQSKSNPDLFEIRVLLGGNDYLSYTERESVEGRVLFNDILATFKFKD